MKGSMRYWKYDLDVNTDSIISTMKFPLLKHLESCVNLLHYGKSIQLREMKPYKQSKDGVIRFVGRYDRTKLGRIKISF